MEENNNMENENQNETSVKTSTKEEVKTEKNHNVAALVIIFACLMVAIIYILSKNIKSTSTNINNTSEAKDEIIKGKTSYETSLNYIEDLVDNPGEKIVTDFSNLKGLTIENSSLLSNDCKFTCENSVDDKCENISFKVSSNDIYELGSYENKYYYYKDNNVYKIYNNTTKRSYIINAKLDNIYDFELAVDKNTDELVGIIYREKQYGNLSFLSLITGEVLYKNKYKEIFVVSKNFIDANIEDCTVFEDKEDGSKYENCTKKEVHLLSSTEEKVLKSIKITDEILNSAYGDVYYSVISNGKNSYISEVKGDTKSIYNYDLSKKIISDNVRHLKYSINSKGYLYVKLNDVINIYNTSGNLVKTVDKYQNIQFLIGDYVVAVKNDNLIITKLDGEEVFITEWDFANKKFEDTSDWGESFRDSGIYLIVKDYNIKKEEVLNYYKEHSISYDEDDMNEEDFVYIYRYNPETKEITKIPSINGNWK